MVVKQRRTLIHVARSVLLLMVFAGVVRPVPAMPTETPLSASYRILVTPENMAAHAFDVEMAIPLGGEPELVLQGAQDYGGVTDFTRWIRPEAYVDGHPVPVTRSGHGVFKIAVPAQGTLQFRYRYTIPSRDEEDSECVPALDARHLSLDGATVFLRPQLTVWSATLDVVMPKGWSTMTNFGEPPTVRLPEGDMITKTLIIGGDYRAFSVPGQPHTTLYGRGEWADKGAALAGQLNRIVGCQTHIMGPVPYDELMVVVNPGESEDQSGTAIVRGLLLQPAKGVAATDPSLLTLFAHEHFHNWLGKLIRPADGTQLKPFFEGFTSYYEVVTALRAGVITPLAAVRHLEHAAERMLRCPLYGRLSSSELEQGYWRFDGTEDLAYGRGPLAALWLDQTIRASAPGKSLDDVMRLLLSRARQGERLTLASLHAAVKQIGGGACETVLDAALSADEIPLAQIFQAAGIRSTWQPQSFVDFGFLPYTDTEGRMLAVKVVPGGPASQAGLQEGAQLEGRSLYWRPSAEPCEVTLKGGKTLPLKQRLRSVPVPVDGQPSQAFKL
jgi:predicted metalloprotease with PDZ domain